MEGQQPKDGSRVGLAPDSSPGSSFKPYTSILTFSSAPARLQHDKPASPVTKPLAPWRRAVGRAHFAIDSDLMGENDNGLDTEDGLDEMMEWTFAACSDQVVGTDVPVIDFTTLTTGGEVDWAVDDHPAGPQVPGEKSVLYDVEDIAPPAKITKNGYV
jgi:hypothetical protein